MAATLSIRVRNETGAELKKIQQSMDATGDSAAALSDDMQRATRETSQEIARLRREQSEEIRIIHEQRASWSSLAATAVPAVTSITVAGVKYAGMLATLAARQKALETVMAPLASSQRALSTAIDLGERAAVRGAASLAGYGQAAGTAATVLGGVTIGLKGYEALLSRTGKEVIQHTAATDDQVRALSALQAEAQATGQSVESVARKAGISLDSLGAQTTTNLDRLRSATGQMTGELARLASDEVKLLKDAAFEVSGLKFQLDAVRTVWHEIDASATRSTNQMIENLGHVQTGARKAYDALNGEGASQRIQDMDHLEAARKREIDDFGRLRGVESELDRLRTETAERRRLDSLTSLRDIDGEINRQKSLAAMAAANNQFDEAAAKRHQATMEALGTKRSQIEADRMKDARDSIGLTRELQQASERNQQSEIDGINAAIRKAQEHADARRKSGITDADAAKAQADADRLAKKKGADPEAVRAAKEKAEQLAKSTNNAKDIEIELSNALRDLEFRRSEVIRSETQKRRDLAKQYREYQEQQQEASDSESARLMLERNKKVQQENKDALDDLRQTFAERRKMWLDYVDWEIDQEDKKQAEIDRLRQAWADKQEKDRKAKVDQIADQMGRPQATGPNGAQGPSAVDQLRSRIRPQDIAKNIGEKRADAAAAEFDKTAPARREKLMNETGLNLDLIDNQIKAERNRVRKKAFTGGFRDAMQGRATPEERGDAESQAANAFIQSAQTTGKLSDAVAMGLAQAAQAAIQADMKAAQALAIAQQVSNALGASQQRMRGVNGTLRR